MVEQSLKPGEQEGGQCPEGINRIGDGLWMPCTLTTGHRLPHRNGMTSWAPVADHPLAGWPTVVCRWCTAQTPFVWCVTSSGKRIPIEPEPNSAGNVEIIATNPHAAPFAIVHAGAPGMLDDWTPYMPHHATCTRDKEPRP